MPIAEEPIRPPASRSISLGDTFLGSRAHICAFFSSPEDEYRLLLPFVKEGLECGEKAIHTVNPQRREDHLRRLEAGGIDVAAACENGNLEVRDWTETHLRHGEFDPRETLDRFAGLVKAAQRDGYPLIRFITHMEWVLENRASIDDLLEYEAKANEIWLAQKGPVNPVVCTYDLTKFRGDVVVDIMRTHPMIIIGGILQENPFFVPPDEFLRELRERRAHPAR